MLEIIENAFLLIHEFLQVLKATQKVSEIQWYFDTTNFTRPRRMVILKYSNNEIHVNKSSNYNGQSKYSTFKKGTQVGKATFRQERNERLKPQLQWHFQDIVLRVERHAAAAVKMGMHLYVTGAGLHHPLTPTKKIWSHKENRLGRLKALEVWRNK